MQNYHTSTVHRKSKDSNTLAYEKLAKIIRTCREHRNLTQAEVAEKMDWAISQKHISAIESAQRGVSTATLFKLFNVLRFDLVAIPKEDHLNEMQAVITELRKIAPALETLLASINQKNGE